ncbi:MAG: hypothetical protein KAR21_02300 [Spirochaetales bacterium]|nr:hypothetical protein [Spirochaetales bacterium]
MSDRPEMKNENSSRNRRRNNYRRPRNKKTFPVCPICNQSVKFLLTAISVGENNSPAHFDCVLKQISKTEDLGPKEKITYIGNGNFAIVSGKSGKDLIIRKKIEFEGKDSKGEWRKRISRNIKDR